MALPQRSTGPAPQEHGHKDGAFRHRAQRVRVPDHGEAIAGMSILQES